MSNITATNIRKVIAKNESVRVTDVASRLFTTNKQAVRRLMNKMQGAIDLRKIQVYR